MRASLESRRWTGGDVDPLSEEDALFEELLAREESEAASSERGTPAIVHERDETSLLSKTRASVSLSRDA